MSDLALFAIGCIVTLMVAAAIGVLLYAAADEPRPRPASAPTKSKDAGVRRAVTVSAER